MILVREKWKMGFSTLLVDTFEGFIDQECDVIGGVFLLDKFTKECSVRYEICYRSYITVG